MKLLSTIIGTLLTLAMIPVIVMALTGNLTFGINAGHPSVNGVAVVWASVNQPPESMAEINAKTVGTAAAGELPGIGAINTVGNADIAEKIGAK